MVNKTIADAWEKLAAGEEFGYRTLGLNDKESREEVIAYISQNLSLIIAEDNSQTPTNLSYTRLAYAIGSQIYFGLDNFSLEDIEYIALHTTNLTLMNSVLGYNNTPARVLISQEYIQHLKDKFGILTYDGQILTRLSEPYHLALDHKRDDISRELNKYFDEKTNSLPLEWKLKILNFNLHCDKCFDILTGDSNE